MLDHLLRAHAYRATSAFRASGRFLETFVGPLALVASLTICRPRLRFRSWLASLLLLALVISIVFTHTGAQIEIVLPDAAVVRVGEAVDQAAHSRVLVVLRAE